MYSSNPARKLHTILMEVDSYCKRNIATNFKRTWGDVLGHEEHKMEIDELGEKFFKVLNLYKETRSLVESNERLNKKRNLEHLDKIRDGLFEINFDGNMNNFNINITDVTLVALDYIADDIGDEVPTIEGLSNEQTEKIEHEVEGLKQEVSALIDDIVKSSLPNDIKQILYKCLSLINDGMYNYQLFGLEEMRSSLERSIGIMFTNGEHLAVENENPNVKKAFNIISKISQLINTANSGVSLITSITSFFLPSLPHK